MKQLRRIEGECRALTAKDIKRKAGNKKNPWEKDEVSEKDERSKIEAYKKQIMKKIASNKVSQIIKKIKSQKKKNRELDNEIEELKP